MYIISRLRNYNFHYIFVNTRNFMFSKLMKYPTAYTAELYSDVEEKLETCEIKPKNHPGIRKYGCVSLPEQLVSSLNVLLEKYDKAALQDEAAELRKLLWVRQLPMESHEIQARVSKVIQRMNDDVLSKNIDEEGNISEVLQKFLYNKLQHQLTRWNPIEYTDYTSVMYLLAQISPNYATACRVFSEIKKSMPSFSPTTFFDFGSGVGSAIWAANTMWGQSLKEYFCVDTSAEMNLLSELLLKGGNEDGSMFLKDVYYRQFLPASRKIKYDVVVSAFSMMDIPSASERLRIIDTLWQKTNHILIIIENGTYSGFLCTVDARDYILQIEKDKDPGVHILAPCPHEMACPRFVPEYKYPCNFQVKYFPYTMKGNKVKDVETSVFSYVILCRGKNKGKQPWPRIIRPIIKHSKRAHCRMCCSDGQLHHIIFTTAKHGKHAYSCARKSSHGDLLPVSIIKKDGVTDDNTSNDDFSESDNEYMLSNDNLQCKS